MSARPDGVRKPNAVASRNVAPPEHEGDVQTNNSEYVEEWVQTDGTVHVYIVHRRSRWRWSWHGDTQVCTPIGMSHIASTERRASVGDALAARADWRLNEVQP